MPDDPVPSNTPNADLLSDFGLVSGLETEKFKTSPKPPVPIATVAPSSTSLDASPGQFLPAVNLLIEKFDAKISTLEAAKIPHRAETLMREYLIHYKSLNGGSIPEGVTRERIEARMNEIEKRLTSGSSAKKTRFHEFENHLARLARNLRDPNFTSDIEPVVGRVVDALPGVFIPHAERYSRSGRGGFSPSRHGGRRGSPLAMHGIEVENALTVIDAMQKAGFPIENREKAVTWLATFMAESGLDPSCRGDGNTSWGVGQVHYTVHSKATCGVRQYNELFDPYKNMIACRNISGNWQNIGPWHAYPRRHQFMTAAREAFREWDARGGEFEGGRIARGVISR